MMVRTFSSSFFSSAAGAAAAAAAPPEAAGAAPPEAAPPEGTDASLEAPAAMIYAKIDETLWTEVERRTYLINVLARELRDELVEAVIIGLDADSSENLLDISGRRVGVATDLEEKVSSDVAHFCSLV